MQQSAFQWASSRTDRRAYRGFTLVELMIAVAIIGILAAIAYPQYEQHLRRARRDDAKAVLLEAATRQEQFRLNNRNYANNFAALGVAVRPNVQYTFSVEAATAACPINRCYVLRAVPRAGTAQARDTDCAVFRLHSSGRREATNSANQESTARCW